MLYPSEVEYFGAAVNAGSRDDPQGLDGLAHFVEHVLFKGTEHRKSWHIINRMEACGGELNAYTTKETTVVYTVYPTGNFSRASELLGDLLCHSVFPPHELDRERDVVADEINQYRDIPSEAVFDDFEDMIFAGSQLGHNILGSPEALQRFDSTTCRSYLEQNFTAARTVLFYSGPVKLETVLKSIERHFSDYSCRPDSLSRSTPAVLPPFHSEVNLGHHQDNTLMGVRIPSMYSDSRWTISLLANILGGPGMNSLLNVELRERRGLVYSVEASGAMLTDCGLFSIFFGCDNHDTSRCMRLITRTLDRLATQGVSERFLAAAKRQYLGQLMLTADVRENAVMSMARSVLYRNSIISRAEARSHILDITAAQLKEKAENLVASSISVLTLQ